MSQPDKAVIAIIGGGPAGLMAADILGAAGHHVHVYDRKPSLGRKFLMAGRGGLNLTHSEDTDHFLPRYGAAREFLTPFITAFTPDDLRRWCEELGQDVFVGSSGRVFPTAMKASPLLRAWLARLESHGVKVHLRHMWDGWDETGALVFTAPDGTTITQTPDATLLALGGASWPGLGSDGTWTSALQARGITISPLRPSNCGFTVPWSDYFSGRFAGQPLKNIALSFKGQSVTGEMMVTAHGVEGSAVYALSPIIRDAIDNGEEVTVMLDLHPHQDIGVLTKKISAPRGRQSFATFLRKTIHMPPLQGALLHEADPDIATRTPGEIAHLIKAFPLPVTAPFSIDRAISSAGGITRDQLDTQLMLTSLPGVFAAGEMLDWEAPTGGYLLQACFATGHAAAHGVMRWLRP